MPRRRGADLLDRAAETYPSYYGDVADGTQSALANFVCGELTGDGNGEMVVQLALKRRTLPPVRRERFA